jgi:hypothetical protein
MLFVNYIHMDRGGRHRYPADEKYGLLNFNSDHIFSKFIEARFTP